MNLPYFHVMPRTSDSVTATCSDGGRVIGATIVPAQRRQEISWSTSTCTAAARFRATMDLAYLSYKQLFESNLMTAY